MSMTKMLRICAFLVCAWFSCGGEASAATTVRVCAACSTEAQLGAEAWNWGIANMPHYGVFIVTTPAPYTLQRCYQRIYQPYYNVNTIVNMSMSSCPNPGPPLDTPQPPPLPGPTIEPWMVATSDYYIKAGDYNRDGQYDLYVTGHPTRRRVADFIVYNYYGSYTINANPSTAERTMSTSMPLTAAKVSRVDLNGDGNYDFMITDTDGAIPNHTTDIIVTTNKGGGSTPQRVVGYTAQMKADVAEMAEIFKDPTLHYRRSHTTYCHRIDYVYHYFYRAPNIGGNVEFPSIPTTVDQQLAQWMLQASVPTYYGNAVTACYSGMVRYSSAAQRLLQKMEPTADGPDAAMILSAILSAQWNTTVIGRGLECNNTIANAQVIAGAAVLAALIIIIHEATADVDPEVVQRAISELARMLGCLPTIPVPVDIPTTVENRRDAGADTNRDVSVDVIYRFAECQNPESGTQNPPVPGSTAPSSGRLRNNLNNAGCGCPQGDSNEAHHMVARSASDPATRSLLNSCGIDVDYALNGVCLPKNERPGTGRTATHRQTQNPQYYRAVDQRIQNAHGSGGCQGVKNALRDIRGDLVNGRIFW